MSEPRKSGEKAALEAALGSALAEVLPGQALGLGVDIQLIADINIENPNFIERNFTSSEIAYCQSSPNPHASFAGRWAAKEAVAKAVMNFRLHGPTVGKGGGAAMIEVEILMAESGAPEVKFHGYAAKTVADLGIGRVKVSISHSGEYVAAAALVLGQ